MYKDNMRSLSHELAIVIPFYKARHFRELLAALAAQTDSRFNLYIGNDCSDDDIEQLVVEYAQSLPIRYVRFNARLGHISLTQQWERCVELVNGGENWLWVLPDDDLPSTNCVFEFYRAVPDANTNNVNAFRFPIDVIDADGEVLVQNTEANSDIEPGYKYFQRAMEGKISTSLGDIIFNREALLSSGGFVDFPQAWGSDQATVIRSTYGGNVQVLHRARLGFRMSGTNISSQKNDGLEKILARIEFAYWMKDHEELLVGAELTSLYRDFAKKHDYYFVNEWEFHWAVWWHLYRLRIICLGTLNPLPLIKLLLLRLFRRLC